MEDLKTQRVTLGRKGRDHIYGAPSEVAQCRVLWAWIWTSQALYQQATTVIDKNITALPDTFEEFIRTDNRLLVYHLIKTMVTPIFRASVMSVAFPVHATI